MHTRTLRVRVPPCPGRIKNQPRTSQRCEPGDDVILERAFFPPAPSHCHGIESNSSVNSLPQSEHLNRLERKCRNVFFPQISRCRTQRSFSSCTPSVKAPHLGQMAPSLRWAHIRCNTSWSSSFLRAYISKGEHRHRQAGDAEKFGEDAIRHFREFLFANAFSRTWPHP